jgi:MraZ protein
VVQSRTLGFLGQYEHGLDGKNRLFLPSHFRAKSRWSEFILTQGLERCLYLFPSESWHSLSEKLSHLPLSNKVEERAFKRMLLAAACEACVDNQGRILIPQSLKTFAGIDRNVVILGVLEHVEIWAKSEWEKYRKKARGSFEKVAPHLEL